MAYSPSTICPGCYNLRSETSKMACPAYGLNGSANSTRVLPSASDLFPGSLLSIPNPFYGQSFCYYQPSLPNLDHSTDNHIHQGEVNPWEALTNVPKTDTFENRSHDSGCQVSTPWVKSVKDTANELFSESMLLDSSMAGYFNTINPTHQSCIIQLTIIYIKAKVTPGIPFPTRAKQTALRTKATSLNSKSTHLQ